MLQTTYSDDVYTVYGKSTDTKPDPSLDSPFYGKPVFFYEIDTKKAYIYDYDDKTWLEQ